MKDKEVKKLIKSLLDNTTEVCQFCKSMGQDLPKCECMKNKDCAKHIMELWEIKGVKNE